MPEYIMRIATRDPAHPLLEASILECGCDTRAPERLIASVEALAGMLRELKTPERVANCIRANAALANAHNLTIKTG